MTNRALGTKWLIVLCVLSGAGLGYVCGRERADWEAMRRYQGFLAEYQSLARKLRDPAGWLRDSAAWAALEAKHPYGGLITEIKREQAENHCAVTFLIPDTNYRWARLFYARARNLTDTYDGVGYAFKASGFQQGDSIRVVIPRTSCQTTYFAQGLSPGWAAGPPHLDVR